MSKRRVSIQLERSTIDALDAVADEYSISRSRIIRDLLTNQLDETDDLPRAIKEAVPDETRKLAMREEAEQRMLDRQKLREKKHSFDDRIRGHFRQRLEGDAAYTPEGMEDLAEGYREDAEIWFDDDSAINEKHRKVGRWLKAYELGYWARQHSDKIDTDINDDDVSGWFEVGSDLQKLQNRIDEVVDKVTSVSQERNCHVSADAVIEAVAAKWSVCEGAARLICDQLTADDSNISEMLRLGGEHVDLSNAAALTGGSTDDPAELPEYAHLQPDMAPVDLVYTAADKLAADTDTDAAELEADEIVQHIEQCDRIDADLDVIRQLAERKAGVGK